MSKVTCIKFDLSQNSVGRLRYIIKKCIKTGNQLAIYCSMDTGTTENELCQVPAIKAVFIKAFVEYGLLGLYQYQKNLYPEFCLDQLALMANITCSTLRDTNGKQYTARLQIDEFAELMKISCLAFKKLYGIDVPVSNDLMDELMTEFKSYLPINNKV